MGWSRMRGAPRRLPVDTNDLLSPTIDVAARTAWLLRVRRIASPWGATTAEDFAGRLTQVGAPARHSSQISIWESGRKTPPLSVVGAYERALDLAPGELLGPVAMMHHTLRANIYEPVEAERSAQHRALSTLTDTVAGPEASGADWLALAALVTSATNVPPPEALLRQWSHSLASQFVRSGRFDYSSRWSALALLLSDPLIAPIVEDEVTALVHEPGVPLARNAWDVLAESSSHDIADSLITQLAPGDEERTLGISIGLATMVGRRQLSHDDVGKLVPRLRVLSREGTPEEAALAHMLAGRLGPSVARGIEAPPTPVWSSYRHVADPPHFLDYRNAVREASGIDDDRMIERLLQEALSHVLLEKRQMAHQLIAASPYRDAVARTAVHIATSSPIEHARWTAAVMLRQMAPDDVRLLEPLLASSDHNIVNFGLVAYGRSADVDSAVSLASFADRPETSADARLAMAMLGQQPAALTEADRARSRWWRSHGSALRTPATPVG